MTDPAMVWIVDRDSLLDELGIERRDRRFLAARRDDLILALANHWPSCEVERNSVSQPYASAAATLLIPGTRLHVSLTAAKKALFIGALQIVGRACVLNQLSLLDLGATLTSTGIGGMLSNTSALSQLQQEVVKAILILKRMQSSPDYWPQLHEISGALAIPEKDVLDELESMAGKVVTKQRGRWRVIL
jgi:hypothetical protein